MPVKPVRTAAHPGDIRDGRSIFQADHPALDEASQPHRKGGQRQACAQNRAGGRG